MYFQVARITTSFSGSKSPSFSESSQAPTVLHILHGRGVEKQKYGKHPCYKIILVQNGGVSLKVALFVSFDARKAQVKVRPMVQNGGVF